MGKTRSFRDLLSAAIVASPPLGGDDYRRVMQGDLNTIMQVLGAGAYYTAIGYGVDPRSLSPSQARDVAKLKAIGLKFQLYSRNLLRITAVRKNREQLWILHKQASQICLNMSDELCPDMSSGCRMTFGC